MATVSAATDKTVYLMAHCQKEIEKIFYRILRYAITGEDPRPIRCVRFAESPCVEAASETSPLIFFSAAGFGLRALDEGPRPMPE
jgi:hypothetical protein